VRAKQRVLAVSVSPNDAALAQCIGSPAPVDPLFEFYRAQIHQLAVQMYPHRLDERQAYFVQTMRFVTYIYGLAQEFTPENVAQLTEYLSSSSRAVHWPHLTVQ
jgi:hypothetical protein